MAEVVSKRERLSLEQAAATGELQAASRSHGLSLGDCVCLTAATWIGAAAVTADRQWHKLHGRKLEAGEIRVQPIR